MPVLRSVNLDAGKDGFRRNAQLGAQDLELRGRNSFDAVLEPVHSLDVDTQSRGDLSDVHLQFHTAHAHPVADMAVYRTHAFAYPARSRLLEYNADAVDDPSRPLPIRPETHAPFGLRAESALSTPLGVFQGRFGRVSLFETRQPVFRHAHAQFNVMIKVSGADEIYEVDGAGPCRLTRDRLILLNPWTPHANKRSAVTGKAVLLSLYLEPSWVRTAHGRPVHRSLFAQPSATVTTEVQAAVGRLTHMLTFPDPVSGEHLEAALRDALAAVVGTYGAGAVLPAPALSLDSRIRRAVELMKQGAGSGVDIDAVCREVGLSRTRFYDRFRTSLGVSPRLFADGLRLDAAIGMLAQSRRPIGDISGRLGFPAQSQFTRFFREKTGFSPGAYRRSLNGL